LPPQFFFFDLTPPFLQAWVHHCPLLKPAATTPRVFFVSALIVK